MEKLSWLPEAINQVRIFVIDLYRLDPFFAKLIILAAVLYPFYHRYTKLKLNNKEPKMLKMLSKAKDKADKLREMKTRSQGVADE